MAGRPVICPYLLPEWDEVRRRARNLEHDVDILKVWQERRTEALSMGIAAKIIRRQRLDNPFLPGETLTLLYGMLGVERLNHAGNDLPL